MKKKVTLTQIAKMSGYAVSSVSRALAGSPKISQATRKHILQYANRCGYQPSHSRTVAIVTHSFGNYFSACILALHEKLLQEGIRVIVLQEDMLELLEELPVQGVVSIFSENGLEKVWEEQHRCPLVCINTKANILEHIFSVVSDDEGAIIDAVEKLYRRGHRKIGKLGIRYKKNNHNAVLRDQKFQELAQKYNFAGFTLNIQNTPYDIMYAIRKMLAQQVSALICTSEIITPNLEHAVKLLQIRVPEDLTIVAWAIPEQENICQDFEIYAQNYAKIAQTVTQILSAPKTTIFPPEIRISYRYFNSNIEIDTDTPAIS